MDTETDIELNEAQQFLYKQLKRYHRIYPDVQTLVLNIFISPNGNYWFRKGQVCTYEDDYIPKKEKVNYIVSDSVKRLNRKEKELADIRDKYLKFDIVDLFSYNGYGAEARRRFESTYVDTDVSDVLPVNMSKEWYPYLEYVVSQLKYMLNHGNDTYWYPKHAALAKEWLKQYKKSDLYKDILKPKYDDQAAIAKRIMAEILKEE